MEIYRMPAEYEHHRATLMIWPVRPGSWPDGAKAARAAFLKTAAAIAESEQLIMLYDSRKSVPPADDRFIFYDIATDDAWARDICPTFVKVWDDSVYGIDWKFNAWGGDFDGLYRDYEDDDLCASAVCEKLGIPLISARPFVLEGGSIHSDGEGTVITTEECLLSRGRNPSLGKAEIEQLLRTFLGAAKIIWLPYGIYNDETDGHVDNICAFTGPARIVLAWTDDKNDPQYQRSLAGLKVLEHETDAKGRRFKVTKLPIPYNPVCISEEDIKGFDFAEGEDVREPGERLAASYVNFYISNGGVIIPQFGDRNDGQALGILQDEFPERKIYPIDARDILMGGGNIHCITQQVP